ncbi:SMP-30/gluconolactonase/LRE family protein [Actibacterium sp. MT2.3-13A]|uniref:SMP-30/gluconolactonase/LRE family protein n=1 Tax=Actibacterium sp. MT2.3-13A TaxID=2828332 RepID=UPI0032C22694
MSAPEIFDDTPCQLGESPLWHPGRQELFWVDIAGKRLHARRDASGAARAWAFDEHVSAVGWIDADHLLIAGETGLIRFALDGGTSETVCALEADNPVTRANDGRADPWGGFWIGTMGKLKEPGAGAIYRYYRGELRQLYAPLSIPNAICFTPDRRFAHFTDTERGIVWRQALDERSGWPAGEPEVYLDLPNTEFRPDGAVIDSAGRFWCAQFGFACVTCHDPDGRLLARIDLPAPQITCPAFGGEGLGTLYATSAAKPLSPRARPELRESGMTFSIAVEATGQAEPRVIL